MAAAQNRHVLTLRLYRTWLRQTLHLSLFTFFSPSERDAYLRLNLRYALNDNGSVAIGGNLFVGTSDTTFFGQLEPNSNVYTSIRYHF